MRMFFISILLVFIVLAAPVPGVWSVLTTAAAASAGQKNAAAEEALTGLWEAKRRFGPDIRGPLLIRETGGGKGWQAEIAGIITQAGITDGVISFELPEGKGKFQGKFDSQRTKITGQWIQPRFITNGTSYASPVTLVRYGQNAWRGEVSPLEDTFTLYLMIKARNDGSTGAFFRNPERNLGRQIRVDHIERDGDSVKLFAADSAGGKGRLLLGGRYDADNDVMSIYISNRGGTFDFRRVGAGEASDFYPRGRPNAAYTYAPPPALDDGWKTGTLEEVGISRESIEKFIRMIIDTPIDSFGSQEIHGVLIARHGKLVLEEYFHGENRDKPHDIRSAGKSVTATLTGAAIKSGVNFNASSPVYKIMNGGAFPPGLEPRKRALTLENLLTMSSGLDCDDADPKSPGAEDYMIDESGATDYYQYTLALKMIREPGEKAVYCSVQPNLAGGVIARASGRPLTVLFQNLIAGPLQIKEYYMNLTPTGDAYMGGGLRFLPRDFMKLGQLHLNDGMWNGRQVLTREWARRATSHITNLGARKYGYFWWIEDYPYKGRTIRAFFAGGNGGQIVMGIPELDLVIAFYGGNYSDSAAAFIPQQVYVPQYILPAIDAAR